MEQEILEIVMGALLHDIGKFYQRAFSDESELSSQTNGMTQTICPFDKVKGCFTHRHVLWTNEFFERYLKGYSNIANLASYHHKPSNKLEKIIQLADWISSGERIELEEVEEGKSYESPIINIFSSVRYVEMPSQSKICYSSLEKYQFSEEFYVTQDLKKLTHDDYQQLWENFLQDIEFLFNQNNKKKMDYKTWLSLLMKYCIKIPSATPTKNTLYFPDISLFDHLKTTSAIAVCLFKNDIEEKNLDKILTQLATFMKNIEEVWISISRF